MSATSGRRVFPGIHTHQREKRLGLPPSRCLANHREGDLTRPVRQIDHSTTRLDSPGGATVRLFPVYKNPQRAASSFCARASRLATLDTYQRDPRGVGIFRSLSERVIAPMV